MIDRIEQRKELTRTLTIAEHGISNHGPDGCMRVLPSVFTHTGNVSFYITRIEIAFVERRREQDHETITTPDQILFNRSHRAAHAIRIRSSGNNRPRLRDRVDTTLFIARRTQRRAVVEIRATIPVAVPRFLFECFAEVFHVLVIAIAAHLLFARLDVRCERTERGVEKPTEPNTLALASLADAIHTVVPVAAAHQRQTVFADSKTMIERERAVFVNRCLLFRDLRLRVVLLLIGREHGLFEEGNYLVKYGSIAGDVDVERSDKRQPQKIV